MKVITGARGSGKTEQILNIAHENFAYIICADHVRRDQLWRRIRERGLSCPQPITWAEFINRQYFTRGINAFLIDDLDLCVQRCTEVPILAVSLNDK